MEEIEYQRMLQPYLRIMPFVPLVLPTGMYPEYILVGRLPSHPGSDVISCPGIAARPREAMTANDNISIWNRLRDVIGTARTRIFFNLSADSRTMS